MSKNKYFLVSMFFAIVLSLSLLLFSNYVKKISKSYSDFREISLLISNNNTKKVNFISDTLYFGQCIMKEFYENNIDPNCINIFFKNNKPTKIELNDFLFFFITSMKEFSITFYNYSSMQNIIKFSIVISCSEKIIITFEIIKTNSTTQIKSINGVGKFMKKICPILITNNYDY